MTRSYDPHNLPIEGRSWEPSFTQQQAMQRAKYEERLENIQMLQSMGKSQAAIARALGVDRKTIYRDQQEIQKQHMLENAQTLPQRIDLSLQRKQFLYARMAAVVMDSRALNKDVVAAADVAAKLDKSIDELMGISPSDRVTTAALGELYQVFMATAEATGQQQLFAQLLQQHLKGTVQGALVLGAMNNDLLYIDEADPEADGLGDPDEDEVTEHAGSATEVTDEMMAALEEDQDQDD